MIRRPQVVSCCPHANGFLLRPLTHCRPHPSKRLCMDFGRHKISMVGLFYKALPASVGTGTLRRFYSIMGHRPDKAMLLPFRDLRPDAEWILQRSKTAYLFPCVRSQLYANGFLAT